MDGMTTLICLICAMRRILFCLLVGTFACFSASSRAAESMEVARIREIAAMLPVHPAGFGQPVANRAAWENLAARRPELNDLMARAVKLATQPLPEQPDSLFLEFSKNGNRTRWQKAASARREQVQIFTLAECLENEGRFLQPLERTIAALCAERTWVLSAHDPSLKNFRGETIEIDLGSSGLGVELATADYLLGDRLSPATRKLIRENLERRIFAPYRAAVNGSGKEFWWMRGPNNWNSVCLDGVTGAALATIGPAEERAWFLAVAEKNIGYYLAGGFTPDGYCVEGLDYWNYGFGNFTLLAENIRQATGGKMDWLTEPQAAQPALFGVRSEILGGVYTTITDCHPGEGPSGILMNYLCRRFGLDSARWHDAKLTGELYEKAAMAFLPAELPPIHSTNNLEELPWRTWFPDGGVLICRPGTGSKVPFAAAIKGGNNGVSHGHNDVGSYSVVAGKTMVICDPGGEVYTARTFSARRYESKVLNSYGHAAPVVAGQLQRTGSEARGVVVATEFSQAADMLTLDLRSAYAVADLRKLERTFVFRRERTPSLEVRDEIKFAAPEEFETALITWGGIHRISENELEITDGKDALCVMIDTQGRAFQLKQETIDEKVSSKRQPVRLGMALADKVLRATVILRISPVTK
jgi:hypothetical protein